MSSSSQRSGPRWQHGGLYLAKATLQLQAGTLPWRELPRLATEAIAAGFDGETLTLLAPLLGEPQDRIRRTAEALPGVELRLLTELDAPSRSREEALWELARLVATEIVEGRVAPIAGAGEILAIVRDEPDLMRATGRLEAAVEQWDAVDARPQLQATILREASRITARRSTK